MRRETRFDRRWRPDVLHIIMGNRPLACLPCVGGVMARAERASWNCGCIVSKRITHPARRINAACEDFVALLSRRVVGKTIGGGLLKCRRFELNSAYGVKPVG